MASRYNDVQRALELALCILAKLEPRDSRAVSNEYVAMASAGTSHHNDLSRKIILEALERFEAEAR